MNSGSAWQWLEADGEGLPLVVPGEEGTLMVPDDEGALWSKEIGSSY